MVYTCKRVDDSLQHFGILGMHWGKRRFQNKDGSYKSGAEGRYYDEVDSHSPGSSKLKKEKKMSDEDLDNAIERERKKNELTRLQNENRLNEARTQAFLDQLNPRPIQQVAEEPQTKKGMSTAKKLLIGAGAITVAALVAKKVGVFDKVNTETITSTVKETASKTKDVAKSAAKEAASDSVKSAVQEAVSSVTESVTKPKRTRKAKDTTVPAKSSAYDENGNPKVNSGDLDFALGRTNIKSGYNSSHGVDDFKRFGFDTDSWSMRTVESMSDSNRYTGSGENYVRSIAGSIPLTSLLGQYDK